MIPDKLPTAEIHKSSEPVKLVSVVYCHKCQTNTILIGDGECWSCHSSSNLEVVRK